MEVSLLKKLQQECHSFKLLYVEDDEMLSDSTVAMLNNIFNTIVLAKNGQEGLEAYKKDTFDIVLTDIAMPVMDGLTMAEEIRHISPLQVIVVMSAYGDAENLLQLINIGIEKFIPKPVAFEQLINTFLSIATNINNAAKVDLLTQELQQSLSEKESILSHILDTVPVRIFWKNLESRYLGCNKLFAQDAGLHDQSELIGRTDYEMNWSADAKNYIDDDQEVIRSGIDKLGFQERQKTEDGHIKWLSTSKVAIHDANNNITGVLGTYIDISKEKEHLQELQSTKEKLDYQAHHDSLTGLPNRILFFDRLYQAIKEANRYKKKIAIIFIDLDYFKTINDSLGHDVGDKVLVYLATLFKDVLRDTDTVARFGGDEFVILLDSIETLDAIYEVIEKIMQALKKPYKIQNHSLHLKMSLGISVYPDDTTDAQTLIRNADSAMYKAKDEGRNTYEFYKKEMTQAIKKRMIIVENLSHAIENNEFELYYQPQIDIEKNKLTGMEALIRWNSPSLGFVSPEDFIPIAEDSALINEIGAWVFKTALKQISLWKSKGYNIGRVAINISAIELQQENFVQNIADQLSDLGCEGSYIELEITERYTMKHPNEAIKMLHDLKNLGIKLSMDDFGTGYSSLSYLKKIPLDKLKIDQSFVKDLTTDKDDVAIVESIISLANTMGFNVIAEGVETFEQEEILRKKGCHNIQGYYHSKPLPANEMEEFLKQF